MWRVVFQHSVTLCIALFSLFSAAAQAGSSVLASPLASCWLSATVSGQVQPVAKLNAQQAVWLIESPTQGIQFGNSVGSPAEDCRLDYLSTASTTSTMQLTRNPVTDVTTQGYLITDQPTPIYQTADKNSTIIAELMPSLRYPFIAPPEQDKPWYQVRFGGRLGYIAAEQVQFDQGIAVLTYHHILKEEENRYFRHTSTTTSVRAFEQQMALLKNQGYRTISLYDLENYLDGQANFSDKLVALTFDDGLESVHRYAYPILKKYGLSATIFVITSRIKYQQQPWDADGLQFIRKDDYLAMRGTFDLQSHTHFLHRKLKKQPIIFRRSLHNMLVDFRRSIQVLTPLNPETRYLAYPYGGYTALAKKAAQQAGFHLAFSTKIGKVRFGDDRYQLKRIYFLKEDSEQQLLDKLHGRNEY